MEQQFTIDGTHWGKSEVLTEEELSRTWPGVSTVFDDIPLLSKITLDYTAGYQVTITRDGGN